MAAVVGVVATSAQQILVGYMQKKHNITSNFLLAKTSPYMAGSMLLFGGGEHQCPVCRSYSL